jgi:hypothetical protein
LEASNHTDRAMNNQQSPSDLRNRLESVDLVAEEPMPAGWSRRNWVQREAIAFGELEEPIESLPGEETT